MGGQGPQRAQQGREEDGLNSPWATTLLQDIAYHPCAPKDWIDVAEAVLPSPMFIKWTAFFKEECRLRAEENRRANPPIPITFRMLSGTGRVPHRDPASSRPSPYRDEVRQFGLDAWEKLNESPTELPTAGVRQKPGEPLPISLIGFNKASMQSSL